MLRAFSYTLLGLLMTVTATTAVAGVTEVRPEYSFVSMMLAANSVSLPQAAKIAKHNYGGKVVKAETQKRGGRLVHHIRLINKGRVKTVLIDAGSGQVISP
ncbi:PepSY domain-containing protein [Amphritea opalescens]|nr:PepSY domain-containing protein [Amphritea opalescens]